jgi:RNA polymerase sigma factor (sigma-70 family)
MIDFNTISDEDLYQMCIQGDEDAWQYVYNYILTICKWGKWNLNDEPEEFAQQITLHLIEKGIKKLREKMKFKNFIKVMTINKIKDSFKSTIMPSIEEPVKNKKGEEFLPEHTDTHKTHDISIMNIQLVVVVREAITKLSQECQRIVNEYLNYKMGEYKDYKELSRVLGMPVPTISSLVRRCLDKLLAFKEIKSLKAF